MSRSWKGTALPLGAAAALVMAAEAAGCAGDEFTPLPGTTGTGTSGQAGHGGDGGSGAAGGNGGTGGVGGQECFDADLDGVTDCAGDCDDSDPLTYPNAPEVCGDAKDNACGSDPIPRRCATARGRSSRRGSATTPIPARRRHRSRRLARGSRTP